MTKAKRTVNGLTGTMGRIELPDLVLPTILLLFVMALSNMPGLLKLKPSWGELKEGESLPKLPEVDLRGVDCLLTLALKRTRRYCSGSIPFYEPPIEDRDSDGLPVKTIAVFAQNVGNPSRFLSRHSLVVDQALITSLGQLRINTEARYRR